MRVAIGVALALAAVRSAVGGEEEWESVNSVLGGVQLGIVAGGGAADDVVADAAYSTLAVEASETVATLVSQGTVNLASLACEQFAVVGDLTLSDPVVAPSDVQVAVNVSNVKVRCQGVMDYVDLTTIGAAAGTLNSPTGSLSFNVGFTVTTDPLPLQVDLLFQMGAGRRPGVDPARPVSLESAGCSLPIPTSWVNLVAPDTNGNSATTSELLKVLSAKLLERRGLCLALEAFLDDQSNALLPELNTLADGVVQDAPRDIAEAQSSMLGQLTSAQRSAIVNFGDSGIAKVGSTFLNLVLGSSEDDSLPINQVVTDVVDAQGEISLDVSSFQSLDLSLLDGALQVEPRLNVTGLNTFTHFDSFVPVPGLDFSLEHNVTLGSVGVRGRAGLLLGGDSLQLLGGALNVSSSARLSFDSQISLANASAVIVTALALNVDEINGVELGQLEAEPAKCGSPAAYKLNISSVELTDPASASAVQIGVGNFGDAGLSTPAVEAKLNALVVALWRASAEALVANFTRGFTTELTELANTALDEARAADCPAYVPDVSAGALVNFSSPGFDKLRDAFGKTIYNVDDPAVGINKIMRELSVLTDSPPGTIELNDTVSLDVPIEEEEGSGYTFNLTQIRIENPDSFKSLLLLEPASATDATLTTSSAEVGFGSDPLRLSVTVSVVDNGDAEGAGGDPVTVDLDFANLTLAGTGGFSVVQEKFYRLTVSQVTGISCLMSTLDYDGPQRGLRVSSLTFRPDQVKFDCDPCAVSEADKDTIGSSIRSFAPQILEAGLVGKVGSGSGPAFDALNDGAYRQGQECFGGVPQEEKEPVDTADGYNAILYSNLGAAVIVLASMSGVCLCTAAARRKKRATGPMGDLEEDSKAGGMEKPPLAEPASLMLDPANSCLLRMLAPVLIFASALLFVSSNLLMTANTEISIAIDGGEPLVLDQIFNITLPRTVAEFLNGGLEDAGVLMAFLSACLPYARLVLLVCAMVLPPSLLSVKARGNLLCALDFVGKFALADQFIIFILAAVLNIRQGGNTSDVWSGLGSTEYEFTVSLAPAWGMTSFLLGAILATTANMLLRSMDIAATSPGAVVGRRLRNGEPGGVRRMLARKEATKNHIFDPVNNSGRMAKLGPMPVVLVLLSSLLALGGVGGGLFVPIINFQYKGAGGQGLALVGGENGDLLQLSLGDFSTALLNAGSGADTMTTVANVFIQVFFLITVIAVPASIAVLTLLAFFKPAGIHEQRFICFTLQHLAAWNCFDVFLGALFASTIYIGSFVEYAVRNVCVDINQLITNWVVPFGLLPQEEGTCFTVEGKPLVVFFFLVISAISLLVASYLINSVVRLAVEDREAKLRSARGMPSVVPADEKSLGIFYTMLGKYLGCSRSLGFVKVRKQDAAGPMAPRSQPSLSENVPQANLATSVKRMSF